MVMIASYTHPVALRNKYDWAKASLTLKTCNLVVYVIVIIFQVGNTYFPTLNFAPICKS